MTEPATDRHHDVVVIGGGQAGLAAGHQLADADLDFVVLDAEDRTGDVWRRRWHSLRLFTPARHSGLPGLPFPGPPLGFPTKDEVADYLDAYAEHFHLPVQHSTRVTAVRQAGGRFEITATTGVITSDAVVVATGANPMPAIPGFAESIDPRISQLHSQDYLSPDLVPEGKILVVGFGASGAEIAEELALAGRSVSISGKPTFHVPGPLLAVAGGLYWQFLFRVLTRRTPIGRKAAPRVVAHGAPLIRISRTRVLAAGVRQVPRVDAVAGGVPVLADGSRSDADVIIWCTGYRPDYSWITVPGLTFDEHGWPLAPFGLADSVDGLAFVGVPFQVGLTSTLLGGVGRDAELVVRQLGRTLASKVGASTS